MKLCDLRQKKCKRQARPAGVPWQSHGESRKAALFRRSRNPLRGEPTYRTYFPIICPISISLFKYYPHAISAAMGGNTAACGIYINLAETVFCFKLIFDSVNFRFILNRMI